MQPGDILFARIEQHDQTYKIRPCLVLRMSHTVGKGPTVTVAYGTSQRATPEETQPWQLLLRPEDGPSAWSVTGLDHATVFCFDRRFVLSGYQLKKAKLVGSLHISVAERVERVIAAAVKRGWH